MKKAGGIITLLAGILMVAPAFAADVVVKMNRITDQGIAENTGQVTLTDTKYGLLIMPMLHSLKPGIHGFHVHEKPDCGPGMKEGTVKAGIAAGGHFDPAGTGRHEGPYGEGHLGDLPALFVDRAGKAATPVLAPRLKLADIKGRSVMIHQGGDNYSDKPELGGGGARAACGIIP